MKKNKSGYISLILCILFWASIPVASKKILVELSSLEMLFYSTIFSFLSVFIIVLYQNKFRLLKKYSLKDYRNISFIGFLGAYLYYVLLYRAFELTTAQEGFILAYTWPIIVLILAFIILKETLTSKKIISISISFFGILVIVTQGNISSFALTNLDGDILALVGAFIYALFSVLGKKYDYDKTISVFIYFLSALILITVTVFLDKIPTTPSSAILPWILYNGIFVNGVSYIWWLDALKNVDTHIVSTSLYLTPFISLIYIWLLLEEKILFSSLIGLSIIILAIMLQSIKTKTNDSYSKA